MSISLSVCLVTTFYPPASFGGDAVFAERQAVGLAQRGHRVRVIHSPAAHRLLGGSVRSPEHEGGDPGVDVVTLPAGPAAAPATMATYLLGRPLGYESALEELTRGFDVIHFHNPSLLGGPGAFGIGGPAAIRLYTTNEHWLVCPTHTLFRYGREVCTVRTCWRCTLSYRRPPQPWRSTSLMKRQVAVLDALLAPSRFTAELHRQALPGTRVDVLSPPPPSLPDLEAAGNGTGDVGDRPFFLFAGRLEPIKGADWLVRVFAEVRGADLLVVGDGSQAPELRRMAVADPDVRILGRRPHHEVLALARAARAVVVPSAGYETFGVVALEAMALSTPVVVRALGPLPELVESGGGLAVAGDEALARALQELADDPALARRLGEEAKAAVASRYSEARFFRRYFEIVAEVAADRDEETVSARAAASAAGEG